MATELLDEPKNRHLKNLKTPGTHADGKGLYLRVRAEGQGSWTVKFGTKEKSLGPADLIDIETARATHKAMRLEKLAGRDPWALLAPKAVQVALSGDEGNTVATRMRFADVVEDFLTNAPAVAGWNVNSTEPRKYRKLQVGALGKLWADEVTAQDVATELLTRWGHALASAEKNRLRIKLVCDYARAKGYRGKDEVNPANNDDLKNLVAKPPESVPHPAMLLKDVPAFMRDLAADGSNEARALAFLIHTAARTAGARDADWNEITEVNGLPTWIIPVSRVKEKVNGECRIPLTPAALALLGPRKSGRIFDELPHDALDDKLKELRPDPMVPMPNGQPDALATVHGFRSTFRDWIDHETDYLGDLLGELALHHTVGKKQRRSYARGDLLENRAPMMGAWSERIGSR